MKAMRYKDWDCNVQVTRYTNGQAALVLVGREGRELIAKASTCCNIDLKEDETAIKVWTENEGMLEALVSAGVVEDTGARVECGWSEAPIVKILNFDELIDNN
tara:strand:+ start:308 stop:616 length:309 start_codon:yes stop_codon:yes gene_type:complete